jgi:hypothetical protein
MTIAQLLDVVGGGLPLAAGVPTVPTVPTISWWFWCWGSSGSSSAWGCLMCEGEGEARLCDVRCDVQLKFLLRRPIWAGGSWDEIRPPSGDLLQVGFDQGIPWERHHVEVATEPA